MKKIINGRKYDTDTATEIGWASGGGLSCGDFHYYKETLYKKKTGEFFLYGEGGPLSKYSVQVELNGWSGGEDIVPLSEDEAKAWAEENMDVDDYEEIFGEIEE